MSTLKIYFKYTREREREREERERERREREKREREERERERERRESSCKEKWHCCIGKPNWSQVLCSRCLFQTSGFCKSSLSKLPGLNDAQTASLLLRYCGIPKISHLLRCIPLLVIDTAAAEFDCTIINTFEAIIGCKLSVQEIRQLSLPISQGGFGLTKSSSTASVAFLGRLVAFTIFH